MKVLDPQCDLSKFFDCVRETKSRALLLDYDGTLAPFVAGRNKAVPYPGVTDILSHIMKHGTTRLVLISGRRVRGLATLVGLDPLPEMWGCHGGERLLPDGSYEKQTLGHASARALESAAGWMADGLE